jgi:hypothetical protein
MLFLDKAVARRHGYFDGWAGDRFFYTGTGQVGDQEMTRGNLAILRHLEDGRGLRLFRGVRGTVTYLGEFRIDQTDPWFLMEAPESGSGAVRQVIVFRLVSAGEVVRDPIDDLELPEGVSATAIDASVTRGASQPAIADVPVEQQHTEEYEVSQPTTSHTAKRREQTLVLEYTAAGWEVLRRRVRPIGEARELICDNLRDNAQPALGGEGNRIPR